MAMTEPETKTLSLVKGRERFVFQYAVGQEAAVVDALIEMVGRVDLCFDWFDASMISHQLGKHLSAQLKSMLPKKSA